MLLKKLSNEQQWATINNRRTYYGLTVRLLIPNLVQLDLVYWHIDLLMDVEVLITSQLQRIRSELTDLCEICTSWWSASSLHCCWELPQLRVGLHLFVLICHFRSCSTAPRITGRGCGEHWSTTGPGHIHYGRRVHGSLARGSEYDCSLLQR